jgi:hypothetical protein
VFFGRKVEIEQIAEQLRSPAKRSAPEVLAIVGPSVGGKSSLVRAGALPRIGSDALFLPLAPIVPGSDPIGGLEREIAALINGTSICRCGLCAGATQSGSRILRTTSCSPGADSRCKLGRRRN